VRKKASVPQLPSAHKVKETMFVPKERFDADS